MSEWSLVYEGFDPHNEGLREALCTLGNGYFATRGAAEEKPADDVHYPGTYVAGLYNRLDTPIAGRTVTNEDLVNCPNWLPLTFRVDEQDRWFNLQAMDIRHYRQELDFKNGLLIREADVVDPEGRRFNLVSRRLVHMGRPHLAAIELSLTPKGWSGPLTLRSGLDGSVINAGVARYRELNGTHLDIVDKGVAEDGQVYLLVRTNQSRVEVAEAARTRLFRGDTPVDVETQAYDRNGFVGADLSFEARAGETVRAEKVVALYTSRDMAIAEPLMEARREAGSAKGFSRLRSEQAQAWGRLWRRIDIDLTDGQELQSTLRLNLFHITQTISPNSIGIDVGVPARGLHGEAYRGHVFWDEVFVFPPVTGKEANIARGLLMYRYRRLGAARRLAAEAGLKGAMFPWQSGSNGDEETQRLHLNPRSGRWLPDNSALQRHVNLAIVYNIWRYVLSTGDRQFLIDHGAEMAIEVARLFDSLAVLNPETQRYEIRGVMGPDEYHDGYPGANEPGLNNNAYTNLMAVWAFRRLLHALDQLPPEEQAELREKLDLRSEELARWTDITRRMMIPFHDDGIISQFEGYNDLEEFDWQGYRHKYGDISRLDRILEAEGDTPNHYKVSKQADVCMLFYLLRADVLESLLRGLGYPFQSQLVRRNVDYYLARTSHGSTLSSVVHAAVLARVDPDRAWPLFCSALTADQQDIQHGTTREGIHLGAMAGTIDILERSYAGIDRFHDALRLNPRMPKHIHRLRLRENFHRRWYDLSFQDGTLEISLAADGLGPAEVNVWGKTYLIEPGGSILIDL